MNKDKEGAHNMNCPRCQHTNTRVVDSRPTDEGRTIRRRRECESCEYRFTTFERLAETPLVVVKKDGNRESFDSEKLLRGMIRACEKRPIPLEEMQELVDDVERKLRKDGEDEVSSERIGELVMNRLIALDEVAYIRFASVYRQFKDVDTFMNEVKELEKKRQGQNQTNE